MTPKNTPTTPPTTMDEKMDEILIHLRRIDARDKVRMWGGVFRSIISLIPIIILVWSSWYFIEHGAELMKMVANTAASSAAEYTKSQGTNMYDELMKKYSIPSR